MSIPREGSRDTGKGIIVSIYPDVCFAKKDPVPFSVYAIQGEDANTAPTVRMTGQRAHNKDSFTTCCHGDEPGVAGVKSGTVGSICQPKTWSNTVRIEGKPAVRHNDEWWMNNKNTVGKLAWVENTETFEPTTPIKEYQVAAATAAAAQAAAPAGQAGGSPTPLRQPSTLPPVSKPGEVIYPDIEQWKKDAPKPEPKLRWWKILKWTRRIAPPVILFDGIFVPSNGYVINDRIPADATEQALQNEAQRMLNDGVGRADVYRWHDEAVLQHRQQIQEPTTETRAPPVPHTITKENVRTTRDDEDEPDPCEIGPYSRMTRVCSQRGGQAHHIVPDFALRTGPRPRTAAEDTQRIQGMPTLAQGMAICLAGQARVSGGEHFAAHRVTDVEIANAGIANVALPGTAMWRDVRSASLDGIAAAKPDCLPAATAAVAAQFAGVPNNQLVRAVMDHRLLSDDTKTILQGGSRLVNGQVITP